jgi:hypothetical protein
MSNSGITMVDVRNEAMDAIKQLKEKTIDVQTAREIRNLLDTVIDTGKTQVEFLKAIPNSIKEKMGEDDIKAIAGTLRDQDAELDQSLIKIEKANKTYEIPKKSE